MNERISRWKKKLTKENMAVFALVGLLLMVIALPTGRQEQEDSGMLEGGESAAETQEDGKNAYGKEEESYVKGLEERLTSLLSNMEGVGKVQVMITLSASEEKVVEKDVPSSAESTKESDSEGGTRESVGSQQQESTVYVTDSAGNKIPYVSKTMQPAVEGVTVVAQGGEDAVIQKNITEVIEALFDIEAHKIKVVKMK